MHPRNRKLEIYMDGFGVYQDPAQLCHNFRVADKSDLVHAFSRKIESRGICREQDRA